MIASRMSAWGCAALLVLAPLSGCTEDGAGLLSGAPPTAAASAPTQQVVLLDGTSAAGLAIQAAEAVWQSAPVAVVVAAADAASAAAAAIKAKELAVPVFALPDNARAAESAGPSQSSSTQISSGQASSEQASSAGASPEAVSSDPGTIDALRAQLSRLGVKTALTIGAVSADELGVAVVSDPTQLPEFTGAAPIADVTALSAPTVTTPAAQVALGSLAAAGAGVLQLNNRDPRQRAEDVVAMASQKANRFIAVGAGFGPLERLTTRVRSAVTGVQLPGGGQTVFYDKRYVAMYGHPLTGALGVLGEQGPDASVVRVNKIAQPYQQYTDAQVIPAFEIIATVAAGSPGKDKNYSNEWDPEVLMPYIKAAKKNDVYVLLDLQTGMSDFLSQAKLYEELLKDPQVGLALDPEWKLKPGQKPLAQFGSVDAEEINQTSQWLAQLVRDNDLPQKMFLIHQFRLDMVTNKDKIDMSHDELAYVSQMDGTGSYPAKKATWDAVTAAAPKGMLWGWKNFYDEDQPTMTPQQTYSWVKPAPVWVSYQ